MKNLTMQLQTVINNGTLSSNERLKILEDIMNQKEILANYEIKQMKKGNDNRYWVKLPNGSKIKKKTREAIEKEIIKYHSAQCDTLASLYESWIDHRKITRSESTWGNSIKHWNRFIKNSPIAHKDITKLTCKDGDKWFKYFLSQKPDAKEHYFKDVRSNLNSMIEFAIKNKIISENPFDLSITSDLFVAPTKTENKDATFSPEEKKKVKTYAYADALKNHSAIPLAIILTFCLGLRDGELCALKWSDISDNNHIVIQRGMVQTSDKDTGKSNGYKIANHTKTKAGNRTLKLNSEAQQILKQVKEYNIKNNIPVDADSLIFQRYWRNELLPCNIRCFDSRIRRYCRRTHMEVEKSMHDIRRTVITDLHYAGMPLKELSIFAGHDSMAMTERYIKSREPEKNEIYLEMII